MLILMPYPVLIKLSPHGLHKIRKEECGRALKEMGSREGEIVIMDVREIVIRKQLIRITI